MNINDILRQGKRHVVCKDGLEFDIKRLEDGRILMLNQTINGEQVNSKDFGTAMKLKTAETLVRKKHQGVVGFESVGYVNKDKTGTDDIAMAEPDEDFLEDADFENEEQPAFNLKQIIHRTYYDREDLTNDDEDPTEQIFYDEISDEEEVEYENVEEEIEIEEAIEENDGDDDLFIDYEKEAEEQEKADQHVDSLREIEEQKRIERVKKQIAEMEEVQRAHLEKERLEKKKSERSDMIRQEAADRHESKKQEIKPKAIKEPSYKKVEKVTPIRKEVRSVKKHYNINELVAKLNEVIKGNIYKCGNCGTELEVHLDGTLQCHSCGQGYLNSESVEALTMVDLLDRDVVASTYIMSDGFTYESGRAYFLRENGIELYIDTDLQSIEMKAPGMNDSRPIMKAVVTAVDKWLNNRFEIEKNAIR